MQRELSYAQLSELELGDNVRLPKNLNIVEMFNDLEAVGLKNPITALKGAKDKPHRVLQGTRRTLGLRMLFENNPERFQELFGEKGIPVILVSGLSEEEIVDMIVDHGQVKGLTDPMELQLACNMLFKAGKTEKQVVITLSGLLESFQPLKPEVRQEWEAKVSRAKKAREAGDYEWANQLQNEAEIFLFNARRGNIQNRHNAFRCPDVVHWALWLKATGEHHPDCSEDLKKTMPRSLTYSHVNALYKAFKADIDADSEGKVTKAAPGKMFWAKWSEICKSIQQAAKEKAEGQTRPKAMAAGDIMQDVDERIWQSKGFRMLSMYHAGQEIQKHLLMEQDKIAETAEIVADGDPDLWADVIKTAKSITEARVAAEREKAAQPATTVSKNVKKRKGGK